MPGPDKKDGTSPLQILYVERFERRFSQDLTPAIRMAVVSHHRPAYVAIRELIAHNFTDLEKANLDFTLLNWMAVKKKFQKPY